LTDLGGRATRGPVHFSAGALTRLGGAAFWLVRGAMRRVANLSCDRRGSAPAPNTHDRITRRTSRGTS